MIRVGIASGEYTTLALPRLQLRAIAISPVDYAKECTKLLEKLEHLT